MPLTHKRALAILMPIALVIPQATLAQTYRGNSAQRQQAVSDQRAAQIRAIQQQQARLDAQRRNNIENFSRRARSVPQDQAHAQHQAMNDNIRTRIFNNLAESQGLPQVEFNKPRSNVGLQGMGPNRPRTSNNGVTDIQNDAHASNLGTNQRRIQGTADCNRKYPYDQQKRHDCVDKVHSAARAEFDATSQQTTARIRARNAATVRGTLLRPNANGSTGY